MELIDNAKEAPKMWSVRLGGGALLAALVQLGLSADALNAALPLWAGLIPESALGYVSALLGTAAIIARVIKQSNLFGNG